MERKKLDPQINSPMILSLLFDDPIVGEGTYGKYYMYGVKNGKEEYSFFAPLSVHEKLKDKPKGTVFQLTKTATQKGKKLVTDFEISFPGDNDTRKEKDAENKTENNGYYETMLQCYEEATAIQKKFSAVNLNQCAVTLFIARTKTNGFINYPKE